jgi:hypothetical protein
MCNEGKYIQNKSAYCGVSGKDNTFIATERHDRHFFWCIMNEQKLRAICKRENLTEEMTERLSF